MKSKIYLTTNEVQHKKPFNVFFKKKIVYSFVYSMFLYKSVFYYNVLNSWFYRFYKYSTIFTNRVFFFFLFPDFFQCFRLVFMKLENYSGFKKLHKHITSSKNLKFRLFFSDINKKKRNFFKHNKQHRYNTIKLFFSYIRFYKPILKKKLFFILKKTQLHNSIPKLNLFKQNCKIISYIIRSKQLPQFYLNKTFNFFTNRRFLSFIQRKKKKFKFKTFIQKSALPFFWGNKNLSKLNYVVFYFWQTNNHFFKLNQQVTPQFKIFKFFFAQPTLFIFLNNTLKKNYVSCKVSYLRKLTLFNINNFRLYNLTGAYKNNFFLKKQFYLITNLNKNTTLINYKPVMLNVIIPDYRTLPTTKQKINTNIIFYKQKKVTQFWKTLLSKIWSLFFKRKTLKITKLSWFVFFSVVPANFYNVLIDIKTSNQFSKLPFKSNIVIPSLFNKFTLKGVLKKLTKTKNFNYFLFFNIFISNFLEMFFKMKIYFKIRKVRKLRKKFRKTLFFRQLFFKLRYYYFLIGKGFFLKETFDVIWLTFLLKDSEFFIQWFCKTLERIDVKKHKKFLSILKKLFCKIFKRFYKYLKCKGFFFDIRGKVGVGGNAKKRHVSFSYGKNSFSEKQWKLSHSQNIVRTHTGVLGVNFIIFFE